MAITIMMSKSTLLMLIIATYSRSRSPHAHLVDVDLPEEVHPDQLPHEPEHQVALLLLRSVQDLKHKHRDCHAIGHMFRW